LGPLQGEGVVKENRDSGRRDSDLRFCSATPRKKPSPAKGIGLVEGCGYELGKSVEILWLRAGARRRYPKAMEMV